MPPADHGGSVTLLHRLNTSAVASPAPGAAARRRIQVGLVLCGIAKLLDISMARRSRCGSPTAPCQPCAGTSHGLGCADTTVVIHNGTSETSRFKAYGTRRSR
jgi:hypothetical protein